ncbi:aldehyde dehydrogenase family protein [Bacillus sp. Marseille-P3661]|uniref:aldehyde dehydrogenase family protein n=1 Tax=Bacillus sp. Marseille-P3661 TaxID=1936234 RepID=UPI002155F647|nr:aldehyde dehydrogenase family protein [Bacillus sp. Marseille-P3661]
MEIQYVNQLINNQEISTEQNIEIRDPGRISDMVARVSIGTKEHVDMAVQAAYSAFESYRKSSVEERIELMIEAADRIEKEKLNLATTLVREQGMLLEITLEDVSNAIATIRNHCLIVKDFFKARVYEDENSWVSLEKRPVGVVGAIVPWNAPMALTFSKVAPALLTGNTIVVKPSSNAPVAVTQALKIAASIFPPGVINIVLGSGSEVGAAIPKHPLIRKVAFTGGTAAGQEVMKDAASTIKNVSLELGGNDPAIILDDVNPAEMIPKLIKGAFRRSGQVCFAIKRVYVPKTIYHSFYDTLCQFVDEYKVGHGLDNRSTFGPVNNESQYKFIKQLIEKTKQSQAIVQELGSKVEPGEWNNGYYLLPMVVKDVDPTHELVTCEQFGPIVPVVPYDTVEQVIKMANQTEFGLSSSVWSNDFERALQISREIEAGLTYINGHGQSQLGKKYIPFGGVKQSGLGRERTEIGMEEYIEYHGINFHK